MNTANVIAKVRKQQMKKDIKHLTKPLQLRAIIVVLLIVIWGAAWRTVHSVAKQEVHDVLDSR